MRKHYLSFFLALFVAFTASAQVTTSSINGVVKDASGKALEGATITATHTPSGTVYNTISKKLGVFNLSSVRIGGPYTIKVNFVGFGALTVDNINLLLGEPFFVNAVMNVAETTLSGVVVVHCHHRDFLDGSATSGVSELVAIIAALEGKIVAIAPAALLKTAREVVVNLENVRDARIRKLTEEIRVGMTRECAA